MQIMPAKASQVLQELTQGPVYCLGGALQKKSQKNWKTGDDVFLKEAQSNELVGHNSHKENGPYWKLLLEPMNKPQIKYFLVSFFPTLLLKTVTGNIRGLKLQICDFTVILSLTPKNQYP